MQLLAAPAAAVLSLRLLQQRVYAMAPSDGAQSQRIQESAVPATPSASPPTYAKITAAKKRPSKEDAIVIDSIDGLTNDDYIDSLEVLTNVNNIRHISKISGSRVIVYLSNSDLVQELKNKVLQVKDYALRIKPYVNNNKRVVISNVHPIIPDDAIINALKNKGIHIVSHLSDLRASLSKPGRTHILSLRRQFYIKEEDESILPSSLQISFDNTTYWTYLSTETARCFICKQSGHIAKVCESNNELHSLEANNVDSLPEIHLSGAHPQRISTHPSGTQTSKRPLSISNSDISTNASEHVSEKTSTTEKDTSTNKKNDDFTAPVKNSNEKDLFKTPKQKKKKRRLQLELESPDDKLLKIKQDKAEQYLKCATPAFEDDSSARETMSSNAISFSDFQNFIKNSYTKTFNVYEEALKITDNILNVTELIQKVYPMIEDKSFKTKLTRLKNALILHDSTTLSNSCSEMENESDSTNSVSDG